MAIDWTVATGAVPLPGTKPSIPEYELQRERERSKGQIAYTAYELRYLNRTISRY